MHLPPKNVHVLTIFFLYTSYLFHCDVHFRTGAVRSSSSAGRAQVERLVAVNQMLKKIRFLLLLPEVWWCWVPQAR